MIKIDALKRCAMFAELAQEELTALSQISSVRHVGKDSLLFMQNDQAMGFFVLLTGSVKIYKSSPDGKEYTLHIIRPGQMFAEAAIFGAATYPADCIALEDSEIAFFPKTEFMRLIAEYPELSMKMIISLSAWLREFSRKLEDLSLREIPARLASYLLEQAEEADSDSFDLSLSKTQLASHLGTIIETLSRNLKKLRERGIIEVDSKRITIHDRAGLESIADGEKI